MIQSMLLAGAGGFAGTCCRYLVNRLAASLPTGNFPAATFAVNIAGCFLIGAILGWLGRNGTSLQWDARALLVTGFCGGFTTFSAFADDMWRLGVKGEWTSFTLYLTLSIALGVAALMLGRKICA